MSSRCVLIPAYNEAKTIGNIVKSLRAQGMDVMVVDDCSSDNTSETARQSGAVVLEHKKNCGKGKSLKDGLEYLKDKNYEEVVFMDGDGQHDSAEVVKFFECARMNNSEMIIGDRMHDVEKMPFVRRMTNVFMSWVISVVSGQKISDSQSGFRYLKMDLLRRLDLKTSNYEIESEMIIEASRAGARVDSMPIKVIYEEEKSKIHPILDTWRFILFIIGVLLRKIKYQISNIER